MKTINESNRERACCELQASELLAVWGGGPGTAAAWLAAFNSSGWQPHRFPNGFLGTVKDDDFLTDGQPNSGLPDH
jgi:hypothetical protein